MRWASLVSCAGWALALFPHKSFMRMRAGLPGLLTSYKQPLRVKKIGMISEIFGDDLFGSNTRKFQSKTEASVRICSGRRVDCFFFLKTFSWWYRFCSVLCRLLNFRLLHVLRASPPARGRASKRLLALASPMACGSRVTPRDSSKWWACSQANCFSDTLSSWEIVVHSIGPNVGQRRERT